MIVAFTAAADAELRDIESYIARDNPNAARCVVDDLVDACLSLENVPERGAPLEIVRGVPLRRLVRPPYLIVYSIMGDVVRIHRIRHGARSPRLLLKGLDLS